MGDVFAEAAAAWPGVTVAEAEFLAYLDARAEGGDRAALRHTDLYLACALARSDPTALKAFEAKILGPLTLPGVSLHDSQLDEVKQRLREKLLVAKNGEPPKITQYRGKGDLGRFLRIAGTREALTLIEQHARERTASGSLLSGALRDPPDQEVAYLRELYRTEFKEAFEGALETLTPRDRTILRYQVIDGFSIDQIGAVYGVHRATAARWAEKIRGDLFNETRDRLMKKIKIEPREFESIMRLIQSQLHVSIARLLADEEPSPVE